MKQIIRKILFYLFTAWAALTINFIVPRLMPGDPVQSLMTRYQGNLSTDAIQSLTVLFGLDKETSLWEQYVTYFQQVFRGDLGLSFTFFPSPVISIVAQSLPWTIALVGIATVISFVLGSAIGMYLGWRRGTWADSLIPLTTFFSSVPYFWIGLLAIALLAVAWPIFPASGGYESALIPAFTSTFIGSVLYHAILPAFTIVLSSISGWILGMRNMMVTVSSEDYVTVAHAKGLSEGRVMVAYAARNAVLPQISGFALSLGFVVSGTLVMEMVFSYPGVGYVLYQAVQSKDYPLMQGVFLVITFSVLVANILADVVYAFLDPRIRQEA